MNCRTVIETWTDYTIIIIMIITQLLGNPLFQYFKKKCWTKWVLTLKLSEFCGCYIFLPDFRLCCYYMSCPDEHHVLYVKEEMKSPLTWRKLKGVPLLKAVNLLTSTFYKLFSKQLSMISSEAGFYWYINRKYAIAIRNVYDVSLSNDISFENYQ